MPARKLPVALLASAFALSGFAGLVYESIWATYLKLFLGHAAHAQALVLIVFVGGMAIGAAGVGTFSSRIGRPLLAYAIVEALVGAAALVFHPLYVGTTGWAYASLLPAACDVEGVCIAAYAVASFLILPQSILLGATFPLMTAGLLRAMPGRTGERIALLYFLNSFGAVFGVLASGFLLIPALGLPGTMLTAGLLNIGLAMFVYFVQRSLPQQSAETIRGSAPSPADSGHDRRLTTLLLVAAVTGASSFVYEVAWTRMLSLVLGASTHSFELMLAAFILGLALGSLWIRRRIDRFVQPVTVLAVVQVLMGAFALATLPIYAGSFDALAAFARAVARTTEGYALFIVFGSVVSIAVMLPAAFLAGMTLPLITAALLRGRTGERAIGWVYGANTLGSIVGVMLCVNLLMPLLGLRGALIGAALADIALGIVLLATAPRPFAAPVKLGLTLAAAAMVSLAGAATPLDPLKLASGVYRSGVAHAGKDVQVLFHRDGKTASVDVLRTPGGVLLLRTNGKTDASLLAPDARDGKVSGDEATQVLLAALPLAHRPDAKRAAVVGFGSGMTSALLLESPNLESLVTIEIEPAMVEGARAFLPRTARAYDDPRSRIVIDDAKAYFARANQAFDIIVSEPSNPWVSGVASLFTTQFYEHIARRLTPNGVFTQWIQTYEMSPPLLASIIAALRASFEHFVVYDSEAGDLVIVATNAAAMPPTQDAVFGYGTLGATLRALGLSGREEVARLRLSNDRISAGLLGGISAPANSDYFPYVDQGAALARFMRSSAGEVRSLRLSPVPANEWLGEPPITAQLAKPRAESEVMDLLAKGASAERAAGFVASLTGKAGVGPAAMREELAAVAAIFGDCARPDVIAALWDRIVVFAAETTPFLPRSDAQAMWRTLERSSCGLKLASRERAWMQLFVAVAARDADMTIQAATPLLAAVDLSTAQVQYLVAAAGFSLAAQKNRGAIAQLVRDQRHRIPPVVQRTGWWLYLDNIARVAALERLD